MTAGGVLLMVAAVLICAGGVGVVASVRGVPVLASRSPVRRGAAARFRFTARHGIAAAAGTAVLLLTGWPVAALAMAAAVLFVPSVLGSGREATKLIATSEALADWTRRLADLISSGAAGSTRDALATSLHSVPDPIAAPLRRLVSGMGPLGTEAALRRFAAEVHDPAADKIAGVLILRERNGGPGLADVLTALAIDLDERSRMIRDVEAERAKPRANMRTIVVVTAVLVVGMLLFARTFLSVYSSGLGQVMLVAVAAVFAVALRWMRTLSVPPVTSRVLVDRAVKTTPTEALGPASPAQAAKAVGR